MASKKLAATASTSLPNCSMAATRSSTNLEGPFDMACLAFRFSAAQPQDHPFAVFPQNAYGAQHHRHSGGKRRKDDLEVERQRIGKRDKPCQTVLLNSWMTSWLPWSSLVRKSKQSRLAS